MLFGAACVRFLICDRSNSPHIVVVIWAQGICVRFSFFIGALVLDLVSGQPLTCLFFRVPWVLFPGISLAAAMKRSAARMEVSNEVGMFFTPGKLLEGIELCSNGRIIFQNEHGTRTEEHGHWEKWKLKNDTQMLSMTFHHRGSEGLGDLHQHTFYKIIAGVYRNVTHWQVLVLQDEASDPEENNPLLLNIGDTSATTVKHILLWLHPARLPAVVLFTVDGQIIFYAMKDLGEKRYMSEPNGSYGYFYERDGDTDTFVTGFHAGGQPTATRTVLRRISSGVPIWRAVGDEKQVYDDVRALASWHIVMVVLEPFKDVVLSHGDD